MTVSQAARRYADALLSTFDDDTAQLAAATHAEIKGFVQLLTENFDLRQVLLSPSFGAEEKVQVLDAVMRAAKLSDRSRRFIRLVEARGRLSELEGMVEAFGRLVDTQAGIIDAVVETAVKLGPSQLNNLKTALEKRTGLKLRMQVKVVPELIGGLRAQIGNQVFDGSLKSELHRLRDTLS